MQSRLAAVVARRWASMISRTPVRLELVHFPFGVEECAHVVGCEEIRGAMRAVGNPDFPGL